MNARKLNEQCSPVDLNDVICIPLECLPIDLKLTYPIYVHVRGKLVFFRHAGEVVTSTRAGSLVEHEIDSVFIPKTNWIDFIRELELGKGQEPKLLAIRHLCMAYLKDVEEKKELFRHELKRYQFVADQLATLLDKSPSSAKSLIRRYQEKTIHFANHSVNTAVYSIILGKALKLSISQLKVLSFAILFHDVGYIQLPVELTNKNAKLTDKEETKFRIHTLKGAKILEKLSLPNEVVETAMQHHEYIDGTGYPIQIKGSEMHLFAKICSIASDFDDLQNADTNGKAMTASESKKVIISKSAKFDPDLLKVLLQLSF